MDFTNTRRLILKFIVTMVLSISFMPASLAEEIPLVDGNLWLKSSTDDKHSYLIGVSNFLSVEYAYQKAANEPVADEQSTVRRFFDDIDDMSLDEVTGRIDGWYRNHPDRLDSAVLNVIWVDMVEPR